MKKKLLNLKIKIAKYLFSWSSKILGANNLESYVQTANFRTAKFVKRHELTDGETAFLLQKEMGIQFDIIIPDQTSDQYKAVMDADSLTVDKLHRRYAEMMVDECREELLKCVTIIPETGPSGRVDYFVTKLIGIQEVLDNKNQLR